ncbi:PaaI family thioesterase [Streptomyces anulatus]|uniref:PaaI family thioesterase n=1 Tax=Streptomyces anulatus TaxID=1892 RepID=UPI002B1CD2BE|nr:PaaI family thioesterase [Streptomyces anulatus]
MAGRSGKGWDDCLPRSGTPSRRRGGSLPGGQADHLGRNTPASAGRTRAGHGGISAMLLDELMGWACAATGTPGMTISLRIRYQSLVPLETALLARAHVTGTDNRKIFVKGSIATETSASTTLVEADGVFNAPDPEAARSLFPALKNAR